MNILHILNDLAADNSRLAKESILTANKDNILLQTVLDAALNPYYTYHIRKIPNYTTGEKMFTLVEAIAELNKFKIRQLTGNDAIQHFKFLLSAVDPDDAIVIQRIIGKDLKCGVQSSTVNKIWPGLIPTYPCMLANPYNEKTAKNIRFPGIAQIKADGMRANAWMDSDGTVRIHGRSGKPIEFNGVFEDRIRPLLERSEGYVFDGELIVVEKNGDIMSRKQGNGILNKAIKGTISDTECELVRFRIWDRILFGEFQSGRSDIPYSQRVQGYEDAISDTPSEYYSAIESRTVGSMAEVDDYFAEALAQGEEGIMLKNHNMPWEDKRSKDIVKFKAEKDCDLEIIGYNPGTPGTKREGKVGSLIVASSDRKVETNISGFSDEQLDEMSKNIQDYIGKIVTVMYNERISSKDKNRQEVDSLFLPRFIELREDKNQADPSDKIA